MNTTISIPATQRTCEANGCHYPTGGHTGRSSGWWILPEITIELQQHEVYQPDIASWRIERMPVIPDEFPVRIAPDWVCEVLSPSTAKRDLAVKQREYHRAGIPHYWVVDPQNHTLSVLCWRDDGYRLTLAAGPGDLVRAEPFDAVELAVGRLFGLE